MKKNSCPDKNNLIAYRLDMLSAEARKIIEGHVAVCPECQRVMQMDVEIDKTMEVPMDPGDIEDIVIQKLRVYNEIAAVSWWRYPLWICLNSLAGFALLIGLWALVIGLVASPLPWLRDLVAAFENIPSSINFYIMYGFGIVFLLTSFFIAFKKNIVKYLI